MSFHKSFSNWSSWWQITHRCCICCLEYVDTVDSVSYLERENFFTKRKVWFVTLKKLLILDFRFPNTFLSVGRFTWKPGKWFAITRQMICFSKEIWETNISYLFGFGKMPKNHPYKSDIFSEIACQWSAALV